MLQGRATPSNCVVDTHANRFTQTLVAENNLDQPTPPSPSIIDLSEDVVDVGDGLDPESIPPLPNEVQLSPDVRHSSSAF